MGIRAHNFKWFYQHCSIWPPAGRYSILEFGSQYLRIGEPLFPTFPDRFIDKTPDLSARISAKSFFEWLGREHVSIDLNGEHGSLVRDLGQPLELGREFDVVTDFGTSEHVGPRIVSLWQCMKSAFDHCKVGGRIFHVNPTPGHWKDHGYWYRDFDFYQALSKASGMEMDSLNRASEAPHGKETRCCLIKEINSVFPDYYQFIQFPIHTE